jgi:hypothetical protein
MTMRTFLDSAGQEWEVFDVVPRRDEERRHYDRRASGVNDEAEPEAPVDRRADDRRLTVGATPRVGRNAVGWLCFEHGAERRRLSPIPEDWLQAPDSRLEEYRRAAYVVDVLAVLGTPKK